VTLPKENDVSDPRQILQSARTILLVDWANPGVPRSLLAAGYTVFGFSPGRYSAAEVVPSPPHDLNARDVSPPRNDDDTDYLVFRRLDEEPDAVDIVNVYRPVEELGGIIARHVLPLGAKVLWLQPPLTFAEAHEARRLASEHGLELIEGIDIAEMARILVQSER
jgi:predicted CoA-binding protein